MSKPQKQPTLRQKFNWHRIERGLERIVEGEVPETLFKPQVYVRKGSDTLFIEANERDLFGPNVVTRIRAAWGEDQELARVEAKRTYVVDAEKLAMFSPANFVATRWEVTDETLTASAICRVLNAAPQIEQVPRFTASDIVGKK